MKLFLLVCFCFLKLPMAFISPLWAMSSFSPLDEQSSLLQNYQKLLNSPLASRLEKNNNATDPYEIALLLTKIFNNLKIRNDVLYFANEPCLLSEEALQALENLIPELEQQLLWLKQDPDELLLRLNSYRYLTSKKTENIAPHQNSNGLQIDSFSLKNSFNPQEKLQAIQSLLSFTYQGLNKLDNWLELKTDGQDYLKAGSYGLSWQPNELVNELRLGQYHRPIGLGLNGASLVRGLEVGRDYQEHRLCLGWFDGLFASIETPWLLNMPFTFYTMQEQKNYFDSDLFHSGVFIKKQIGSTISLASEFTEVTASNMKIMPQGDSSAFAVSLEQKIGAMTLQSSLSHVGNAFIGRKNHSRLLDNVPENIRQNVQNSLSNYFGNSISAVSGSSDLGFGLNIQLRKKNRLELQYNFLYDHTPNNSNQDNAFNLSTLRYAHQSTNNSTFQISLQSLNWEKAGATATSGFAAGYQRNNFTLVQSSYSYSF